MKNNTLMILLLLFISIGSCKKHHSQPRVSPPNWSVNNSNGQYPASMTAVVQMPKALLANVQKKDKLAAFAKNECRGIGKLVLVGDDKVYFVLIHGSAADHSKISFRYYASKKSNLYETADSLNFIVDGNYGTVDSPIILNLQPAKR